MFRVYLRDFNQRVFAETKTNTGDPVIAQAAFFRLVNRTDLDGQKFAVALTCNNGQVAFHRFDRGVGDYDFWRGRENDLAVAVTEAISL